MSNGIWSLNLTQRKKWNNIKMISADQTSAANLHAINAFCTCMKLLNQMWSKTIVPWTKIRSSRLRSLEKEIWKPKRSSTSVRPWLFRFPQAQRQWRCTPCQDLGPTTQNTSALGMLNRPQWAEVSFGDVKAAVGYSLPRSEPLRSGWNSINCCSS